MKIEDIKIVHEELITECKKLYLKDIQALIAIEAKLLGKDGTLKQLEYRLEFISQMSYFPEMNCKLIKE